MRGRGERGERQCKQASTAQHTGRMEKSDPDRPMHVERPQDDDLRSHRGMGGDAAISGQQSASIFPHNPGPTVISVDACCTAQSSCEALFAVAIKVTIIKISSNDRYYLCSSWLAIGLPNIMRNERYKLPKKSSLRRYLCGYSL